MKLIARTLPLLAVLDRDVRLSPAGTFALTIYYGSRQVVAIPVRARLAPIAATNAIAAVDPDWRTFKVTT